MSSPFGPVNLTLLVWRRSPLISSKPQIYGASLRQYMRGARLLWTRFAHHIRFPAVRVFLLIRFRIRLDRAVPGYVR